MVKNHCLWAPLPLLESAKCSLLRQPFNDQIIAGGSQKQ